MIEFAPAINALGRWPEFRRRYLVELRQSGAPLDQICGLASKGTVTLLFGAHGEEHNDAVVLQEVLMKRMQSRQARAGAVLLCCRGQTAISVGPLSLAAPPPFEQSDGPLGRLDLQADTLCGGVPVELAVTQVRDIDTPRLHVHVAGTRPGHRSGSFVKRWIGCLGSMSTLLRSTALRLGILASMILPHPSRRPRKPRRRRASGQAGRTARSRALDRRSPPRKPFDPVKSKSRTRTSSVGNSP
jgi:hypothetical protein